MVVRLMNLKPLMQCSRDLDFAPRQPWPKALPAIAWRDHLVCGFERNEGLALSIDDGSFASLVHACHPQLHFSELARLNDKLDILSSELSEASRETLFGHYGLRWCDRLSQTLKIVAATPREFQDFADQKDFSIRDFSALLALSELTPFQSFLQSLAGLPLSKSEAVRALDLGVELFLMGQALNDLLPADQRKDDYLKKLERLRRPNTSAGDESWKETVAMWPWPAHVQGQWQRFGDQSGLEVKIRTVSPEDFQKKLQRLIEIGETWSCKM